MPISFFGGGSTNYAGQGFSIQGLQEAQQRNLRRIAAMKPGGVRGQAVQYGATEFDKVLKVVTPVDTGSLRASRRITFEASVPRAQVFTSANAYNPRSRTPPIEYDVYLHAHGGRGRAAGTYQASFPHTMRYYGPRIVKNMAEIISDGIRNP